MSAEQVARRHYRWRRKLIRAVAEEARRAWRRVDPGDIAGSWRAEIGRLLLVVSGAQLAAAQAADDYLDAVLAEQDIDPAASGRVAASMLAGVASDGRDLDGLLYQPAVTSLVAIRDGVPVARALAGGYATLDMIARTQVADAGRAADQVALAARREAGGYVRMVVGHTCSRCLILAGRWYAYNAGFRRHPRCRPGATASTSRLVRTGPGTCARTRGPRSTPCRPRSRTRCSARLARRRSARALTWRGW